MASEPLTQEQRARLENVARLYPFVRFRNDDLRAALAHIDAVTAERDRLARRYDRRKRAATEVVGRHLLREDALTAERDRLLALLTECREHVDVSRAVSQQDADNYRGYERAKRYEREVSEATNLLARIAAAIPPPTGHTHPRPCSICRREDCTTEHACE